MEQCMAEMASASSINKPPQANPLPRSFYTDTDVVTLSKRLLGAKLCTFFNGHLCTALITETEAYSEEEKACHAYGGFAKCSKNVKPPRDNNSANADSEESKGEDKQWRRRVLFQDGGFAYVYLCYGMHTMLNISAGKAGHGCAVLIRSIQPLSGIDEMLSRRQQRSKGKSRSIHTSPPSSTSSPSPSPSEPGTETRIYDLPAGRRLTRSVARASSKQSSSPALLTSPYFQHPNKPAASAPSPRQPTAVAEEPPQPDVGYEEQLSAAFKQSITIGPGRLTLAMGIKLEHNGLDLTAGQLIWLEQAPDHVYRTLMLVPATTRKTRPKTVEEAEETSGACLLAAGNVSADGNQLEVLCGPRVGVDYAGKDAELPWRFAVRGNVWCSKPLLGAKPGTATKRSRSKQEGKRDSGMEASRPRGRKRLRED